MGIYEKIDRNDLPAQTIKRYKKIYNIIFKYCFFILVAIIAIIIFKHLSKNTIALNWTDKYPVERQKLLSEINKNEININNKDTQIKFIQWELIEQSWNLISTNNIISYKWFIMPRILNLPLENSIKNRNEFTTWYDINDLEYIIKETIFSYSKSSDKKENLKLLPLTDDSIENTFFVSCLESNHNWLCRQFISNFLDTFYVYDLSKDYNWLKKISNEIIWTEYKDQFCTNLMKYVSYTKDTNTNIEWIVSQCDQEIYDNFLSSKAFFWIQEQLENWYIKPNLSHDPDVNAYKLISYQQILYNNISAWNINEANFTTYLNYISSLLKKPWSIDPIYYDMTYWINNNYLIPVLNAKKYKLTENKKNELEWIITNIYNINYENKLEWHKWLEAYIINTWLTEINVLPEDLDIDDYESDTMEQLLKSLKNLSYLEITNEDITWNVIRINWYLKINWMDEALPFSANFENKNWKLIVDKVWISNYSNLSETINTLLKKTDSTILDVYEYISKSIKLYSSDNIATPCEIITAKVNSIWWSVIECESDRVYIKKADNTKFQFTMKNYNIENITISDKELEQTINDVFWWLYTNDVTIANVIWNILSYNTKWDNEESKDASLNIINTLQTVSQYLWVDVSDIKEQWENNVYIEFTLWNIKFSALYNPDTKTLHSLKFQDKDININYMKLILQNEYANDINNFKINPLKYIEKFDQSAIEEYNSK